LFDNVWLSVYLNGTAQTKGAATPKGELKSVGHRGQRFAKNYPIKIDYSENLWDHNALSPEEKQTSLEVHHASRH